jgi:hypothetical protein
VQSLFEQLEYEWRSLGSDRRTARRLSDVLALAGATDLEGVRRWVGSASPAESDPLLLCLVGRAAEGDQLAGRVMLQLLLPGIRRLARKWWALGSECEREAAAVAAVYDRIRRYPLARRPGKVAANILLDAGAILRRQVHDSRGLIGLDAVRELSADAAVDHPSLELAEVLHDAVREGVLTPADAELIAASRIGGRRLADLAAERGAALRTVQKHRHAAEAALVASRAA